MNTVFIGLGSNIEPRKTYLDEAVTRLKAHSDVTLEKTSSIYETAPVDYTDQDDFLNMVVKIKTSIKAADLLELCQQIEYELGRDRAKQTIEKGPRTIDLDILLFNDEIVQLENLAIPHPRMHMRAFVLVPLHEIAPEKMVPTIGRRVDTLLHRFPKEEIDAIKKWA